MKYRMSFKYIYIYIGYRSDSFRCHYIYFFLWHTGLRTLGMVGVGEGRHTSIGFLKNDFGLIVYSENTKVYYNLSLQLSPFTVWKPKNL